MHYLVYSFQFLITAIFFPTIFITSFAYSESKASMPGSHEIATLASRIEKRLVNYSILRNSETVWIIAFVPYVGICRCKRPVFYHIIILFYIIQNVNNKVQEI